MDYKFTFEDGSEALMHYGVLGMKWGVRHDKQKAFSKSTSKLGKLDARAEKIATRKAKSAKTKERATRIREKMTGNDKRTQRLSYKEEKRRYKANKWARRMNKEFGSVKISATKEQQELGKKYLLSMI